MLNPPPHMRGHRRRIMGSSPRAYLPYLATSKVRLDDVHTVFLLLIDMRARKGTQVPWTSAAGQGQVSFMGW